MFRFPAFIMIAIPINEPERLYPNNMLQADAMFKALAKQWHPALVLIDYTLVKRH